MPDAAQRPCCKDKPSHQDVVPCEPLQINTFWPHSNVDILLLATKGDISTRNLAWILHANQPGSGLYYDWDYLEIQGKNLKVSASNFSSKPCAELGFPSQRLLDHLNFQFCREWPLTVAQPHPDPRNLGENCSHKFLSPPPPPILRESPRAVSASQVPGVGRFSLLKPEPSRPPASAAGPSRNRRTWLGGRVGSISSFEGRWILGWQMFRKLRSQTDSKVQTFRPIWQHSQRFVLNSQGSQGYEKNHLGFDCIPKDSCSWHSRTMYSKKNVATSGTPKMLVSSLASL